MAYVYEIKEEGDVPEKKEYDESKYTLFHKYLDANGMSFEDFKEYFPHDERVLRVEFRNIPRKEPSVKKIHKWMTDNPGYEGKKTPAFIHIFAAKEKLPYPDLYDILSTKDTRTEIISERQLKNTHALNYAYRGGNHKSRRNRKRKNIKKSKKFYKMKKNRSNRINA